MKVLVSYATSPNGNGFTLGSSIAELDDYALTESSVKNIERSIKKQNGDVICTIIAITKLDE